MFANLQSSKLNRLGTAATVAAFLTVLFLSIPTVRAATPDQLLHPALPQFLQEVSQQLPENWHPQAMHNGDVQLNNPVQRLKAYIDEQGIHLKGANGYALKMQLTHFGFNGCLKTPQSANVRIDGVRVDVVHDPDLKEWFINTPVGIEQGFSLMRAFDKPHAGALSAAHQRFELHFKLSGDLLPEASAEGLDFKDPSGRIQMHYHQLLAFDANHQILPARFELAGNYLKLLVDTADAVYPVTIDPLFSSEQELTASDASAEDQFGDAVAVDGDTIVIGAPLRNSGTSQDTGAVYVFVRDPETGDFTELERFIGTDTTANDKFGSAVDVDGNTIVIGAPEDDSATLTDSGSVYVFVRDPSTGDFDQQQKLEASDAAAQDLFGSSVYIEGNTIVVGAPRKDDGTSTAAGAAYVFTRDPNDATNPWSQQQKLMAADASAEDEFGAAVTFNGSTIVVSAPLDNLGALGTIFDAGSLYVFTRDQTLSTDPWTQDQKLTASDGSAGDRLGFSVSIDGNTILAGAPRADSTGFTEDGAAYIFTRPSADADFSEAQILNPVFPNSDAQFGTSVFVDGQTALIGAPGARFLTSTDAGAAFHFTRDPLTGTWSQQQGLAGSDPQAQAEFGRAVGLDAATTVIGSPKRTLGTSSLAGAAYVFVLEPLDDEISQETDKLTAADAALNDGFGSAVGLSGDNTVIGIPDADGDPDLNVGAVSAFERDPDSQEFDNEDTLTADDKEPFDNFGTAVAVDADIAVFGAPDANIGVAVDAGAAYVFNRDLDNGDWDQAVKLDAGTDVTAEDTLGSAVAIDADIILVGAPNHDPNAVSNAGAVFVFSRNPDEDASDQWSQTVKLTADADEDEDDLFGSAVAINSDTALVGAPGEDGGGAVFVFVRDPDDNSWVRQQILTGSDTDAGDRFGAAVAVFGNTAIIGAPLADVDGVTTAGAVYVFTRDPEETTDPWSELQQLEASDAASDDEFGTAVALMGNMAVIGAPGVDLPPDGAIPRVDAGAAYDFRRDPDDGLFSERTQLIADDAVSDEAFGTAVSVGCDTIIIGAPDVDLDSLLLDVGAAFVFQTFEEEDDSDGGGGGGGGSGSSCFIDTARSDGLFNALGCLLTAFIALALTVLRQAWRRRVVIKRSDEV